MPLLRLNDPKANPNPYINFITPLPSSDTAGLASASKAGKSGEECPGLGSASASALSLLRSLAAQVKPLMRAHSLLINSLEEYPTNGIFAGRNWNNGETVELVLRRPGVGGGFFPIPWLLDVLAHELAHVRFMDHGPKFQALSRQFRAEIRQLRQRGYTGDGMWSAGVSVQGVKVPAVSEVPLEEFPEYECGGSQVNVPVKRVRVAGRKKVCKRGKKFKEAGEGVRIDGSALHEKGVTYRKKANSKSAKALRAEAAERRFASASATAPHSETESSTEDEPDGEDEEEEEEEVRKFTRSHGESDKSRLELLKRTGDLLNLPIRLQRAAMVIDIPDSDSDGHEHRPPHLAKERERPAPVASTSAVPDIVRPDAGEDSKRQRVDTPDGSTTAIPAIVIPSPTKSSPAMNPQPPDDRSGTSEPSSSNLGVQSQNKLSHIQANSHKPPDPTAQPQTTAGNSGSYLQKPSDNLHAHVRWTKPVSVGDRLSASPTGESSGFLSTIYSAPDFSKLSSLGAAKSGGMGPAENWTCPSCTFLNHEDLSVCEVCETPR